MFEISTDIVTYCESPAQDMDLRASGYVQHTYITKLLAEFGDNKYAHEIGRKRKKDFVEQDEHQPTPKVNNPFPRAEELGSSVQLTDISLNEEAEMVHTDQPSIDGLQNIFDCSLETPCMPEFDY